VPHNNVIPIDQDAARALHRRETRFRWFVVGLTVVWLGALVPSLLLTPLPPLWPFLALAALTVLAEHRFVLFNDETSMSASIAVATASAVVFVETAPIAGPLLVGACGGLYLQHVIGFHPGKVVANAASMSLAGAATGAILWASADITAPIGSMLPALCLAMLAYWVVNNYCVAMYVRTQDGPPVPQSFTSLFTSDTSVVLWALAACFGAATLAAQPAAQVCYIAAIVAARCVIASAVARGGQARVRYRANVLVTTLLWAIGTAIVDSRAGNEMLAVCGSLALFLVAVNFSHVVDAPLRLLPAVSIATVLMFEAESVVLVLVLVVATCIVFASNEQGRSFAAVLASACCAALAYRSIDVPTDSISVRVVASAVCLVTVAVITAAALLAVSVRALRTRHGIAVGLGILIPSRSEVLLIAASGAIGATAPLYQAGAIALSVAFMVGVALLRSAHLAAGESRRPLLSKRGEPFPEIGTLERIALDLGK
jgi:hypothetical protein